MIPFIRRIVEAKLFHHLVVAVIVLAGVVAGLRRKWAGSSSHTTSDREPEEISA